MGFRVSVAPSGRQFEVQEGETVLDAGIRLGIGLPYGCKDGACGACKCKRISGDVRHQPYLPSAMSADEAPHYVLTCRAEPLSDLVMESAQVTAADAFPVRKLPARVLELERLSADVMRLCLQLPPNTPLAYHAGQYLDIILPDGQRRSYSIATAPHAVDAAKPCLNLHIRHMPGGSFTDRVFSTLKVKDMLRIEGPFGSFYLRDDAHATLLVLASGTGFAPVQAMLEHMQHTGDTRTLHLYWGARRPQDLYMHPWMLDYAAARPHIHYHPVISEALPEDGWRGRSGLALDALLHDMPDMRHCQLYVCGAPAMVEAAHAQAIAGNHLPESAFFADAFTSQKDKAPTGTAAE